MLKKKYRLKKHSAFIATYKLNDVVYDKNICIYFGKKKTSPDFPVKTAFVVSKKIHKRAVVRNRIKRLMRENVRLFLKNNEFDFINEYMSVIFVAKKHSVGRSYPEISLSLSSLLELKSNTNA